MFGLAERHGKGIDIHLHDGGELGAAELRDIADADDRRRPAGPRRGQPRVRARAIATSRVRSGRPTALARAGVAIMTNGPPTGADAAGRSALRGAGVTVFAGSDNIRDCWSPYGNGDMLERRDADRLPAGTFGR